MINQYKTRIACLGLLAVASAITPTDAAEQLPDSKELMRALGDEIQRSMALQMEDLEKPYFIQYAVDDSIVYQMSAKYGDIAEFQRERSRAFYSKVRVGSYELDNTNFSGGGGFFFFGGSSSGGRARLPIEENYTAIRQAIWRATDSDYKNGVETLTKKRAYMKDKNLKDRPSDYSKASIVDHVEPTAELDLDPAAWQERLKKISARFNKYTQIQDSSVRLLAGAGNNYVVNTEGTRLRTAQAGILLIVNAELQAKDGMKISDGFTYFGFTQKDLPAVDNILKDVDELVENLTKVAAAPVLEQYTGPVLFDSSAAAQMFRVMLADGLAAHVDPVGSQRRQVTGKGSLEKKLKKRILPDSFQIYDDPTVQKVGDTQLLGHYAYDDEGVMAERVELVADGVLSAMVTSRAPTKKLSGSNGHARRAPGAASTDAAIGCLFIEDNEGLSDEDLKAKLIEAAEDEGLEYALRIGSTRATGIGSSQSDIFAMFMRMQQRGGQQSIGDPIYAYKVYVADGREELVRGCEFGPVKVRDLKQILAAGNKPTVYNYIGLGFAGATPATSIIAPAVLFEELELSKIEQEHDKPPILNMPLAR